MYSRIFKKDIEDITTPHGYECLTRYLTRSLRSLVRYRVEYVYILYKLTNDDDFRRFPITFQRFQKIFENCCEGQTNVSEHFPKIAEDFRRGTDDVSIIQQHI